MAEPKLIENAGDVGAFLAAIADPGRRADCEALAAMMARLTGQPPRMWGASIVGFGRHRYQYDSGRAGEWFASGFAPRKGDLTIYLVAHAERFPEILGRLGKHKIGKACLYVKRLADIDGAVLEELLTRTIAWVRATYPTAT
jgi:hypothetical protein